MQVRATSFRAALAGAAIALAGVLAAGAGGCGSSPPSSQSQTALTAVAARAAECSGTAFRHSEGVQGLANITYAQADWECNAQGLDLQTSVTSRATAGGPCGRSVSGIVHGLEIDAKATGAASFFCDGYARWRCSHSGCAWTSWRDLETLGQPGTVPVTTTARRACTGECLAVQWNGQVTPPWAQAKWTINDNGWSLRGLADCQVGRSTALAKGGWVKTAGLWSRATCLSGYNALIGAGWDEKKCAPSVSCPYTRHWSWGHAPALRTMTLVRSACHIHLPFTSGDGWAQVTVSQSCAHPAWSWARFHSGTRHYTVFGPHRVAPPGAPKYSVATGTGAPYCGGVGRWYGGAAHYTRVLGSCTVP